MRERKGDIIRFFVWMRNGVAFCTTWFLILVLAYNCICGIPTISTEGLIKMVFWIIGGVFIFNLFFSGFLIIKWRFIKRLTLFMMTISLYECLGFYWLGFFSAGGTAIQWLLFVVLILVLYFICIAIYHNYSKKQGEIYTQALRKYQEKRSRER